MSLEFRQYMQAELETMVREMGPECVGDTQKENTRAIDWISRNAARFREEWLRGHAVEPQPWQAGSGRAG